MRKFFKVTITGNYLVVNETKSKYFWISKDQSSCYPLSEAEKEKFFREYPLKETELELKAAILAKVIQIENAQGPDIMLGKIDDMQHNISLAS